MTKSAREVIQEAIEKEYWGDSFSPESLTKDILAALYDWQYIVIDVDELDRIVKAASED